MMRDTPAQARAMMGELMDQPLLQPGQVVAQILAVVEQHGSQGGGGGLGPVRLLLQNGRVVDPFATRAQRQRQQQGQPGQQRPPVAAAGGGASSSAAIALRRFSPGALAAYARQQLPASYPAVVINRLGSDFRAVSSVAVRSMPAAASLPPGQVLVRRLWAGVNASDVNYSAGRYHASKEEAQRQLPLPAGFESVCVVVAAAPDVQGEGTAAAQGPGHPQQQAGCRT
jgi:hypothetical protein